MRCGPPPERRQSPSREERDKRKKETTNKPVNNLDISKLTNMRGMDRFVSHSVRGRKNLVQENGG